jgi:hypothetical protein
MFDAGFTSMRCLTGRNKISDGFLIAFLLFVALNAFTQEQDPVPPTNRPDREALRERARDFAPEERQKMIREFREKHGPAGTNRVDWEKRREEWRQLPPAERQARMREFRESLPARQQFRLNQQQREQMRQTMKQRIDTDLARLQEKKAAGELSQADDRRLQRLQQMSKNLSEGRGPFGRTLSNPQEVGKPEPLPPPRKPQN